ncbi:conserved hypothetical protein [Burkholderia cenocepacia HI2424]|nr:conserved hypothetical protein [Burkholderia cenocepacia HI2424]
MPRRARRFFSVDQRFQLAQQAGEHPRTGVERQHRVVVGARFRDVRKVRQQKAEVHGLAPCGDGSVPAASWARGQPGA